MNGSILARRSGLLAIALVAGGGLLLAPVAASAAPSANGPAADVTATTDGSAADTTEAPTTEAPTSGGAAADSSAADETSAGGAAADETTDPTADPSADPSAADPSADPSSEAPTTGAPADPGGVPNTDVGGAAAACVADQSCASALVSLLQQMGNLLIPADGTQPTDPTTPADPSSPAEPSAPADPSTPEPSTPAEPSAPKGTTPPATTTPPEPAAPSLAAGDPVTVAGTGGESLSGTVASVKGGTVTITLDAAAQVPDQTGPADTPQPAAPAAPAGTAGDVTGQVLPLVNAARKDAGCQPVTADAPLAKVALARSKDMATRGYFDHTNPDGQDPFQVASGLGVDYAAAENIAQGQATAAEVLTDWLASPEHKANIVDCRVTTMGAGTATDGSGKLIWTQLFGAPAAAAGGAATTPAPGK
jgi:uncharacterized protein YkwD